MTKYRVIYGRDIPQSFIVEGDGRTVKKQLSQKIQNKIDAYAMSIGATSTADYAKEYNRSEWIERDGSPEEVAAAPALTALMGLGGGLTPSGDDLLVGFLAGLWCTLADDPQRRAFVSQLGEALIALSPRTNDISRTYLIHAARGKVSSRLKDLAHSLSRGEESQRLLQTAEAAMQTGHTSGMDAVTGLLAGLSVWANAALL